MMTVALPMIEDKIVAVMVVGIVATMVEPVATMTVEAKGAAVMEDKGIVVAHAPTIYIDIRCKNTKFMATLQVTVGGAFKIVKTLMMVIVMRRPLMLLTIATTPTGILIRVPPITSRRS
jgi:hypothetical protein